MPTNSSQDTSDTRPTIERVLNGSRVINAVQRASTTATNWLDSTNDRLTRVVQESFLYRWLTAEPDPEVIVIDLRETYTVGPFIAVLDHVIDWLAPIYRESRLADGINALTALGARAADTRPGRVLAVLFEPPEPPAGDADDRDDTPSQIDTDNDASDRDTK